MIPGMDENSSSETAVVWDQIMRMQKAISTLTCIIAHHTHKGSEIGFESLRGSSRHAGEVDFGIFVERHPMEINRFRCKIDGRDVDIELSPGEVFEGEVAITDDEFSMSTDEFKVQLKAQRGGDKNAEAVLKAVRNGAETRGEIMTVTGLSDNTVLKHLKKFIDTETIMEEKMGEGKPNLYRCAE
jgi:DNA-binding transcriptional ArsR family regulator